MMLYAIILSTLHFCWIFASTYGAAIPKVLRSIMTITSHEIVNIDTDNYAQ